MSAATTGAFPNDFWRIQADDGDAMRKAASVGLAIAIHAALVAIVAGRGPARLELRPAPILLRFVEPAARTEGPGRVAEELRAAAAPASPAAAAPRSPEAAAMRSQEAAAMRSQEAAAMPLARRSPAIAVSPPSASRAPDRPREIEPAPRPVARPKTAPHEPAPRSSPMPAARDAPSAVASAPPTPAADSAASGTSPTGAGAVSSARSSDAAAPGDAAAPAWAPAARVRYEELLFAWIDRHKQYPMIAKRRGVEGSGSIRIRIARDGRVIDRQLVRSTGEPMLDEAALDMVRRSSPFPAVPDEYAGASFEFIAPVEYRLR